jgi:opacity protein-like surface antigen
MMSTTVRLVSSAIALTVWSGTALADGMRHGSLKDAPMAMMPGPMWSGFYAGLGLGYGHAVIENNYWESTGVSRSLHGEGANGGLGTVTVGFDRQVRDRYVWGAFADFDWSSIELSYTSNTTVGEETLRLDWSWAVGLRAGFLLTPTTLLYLAGGYTQAHFDNNGYYDITAFATTFPGKGSITHDGYFAAVGMETLLGHNLGLKGEMRYAEYGSKLINSGVLLGDSFTDHAQPSVLTGRLVLSYRFGHHGHGHAAPEPLK